MIGVIYPYKSNQIALEVIQCVNNSWSIDANESNMSFFFHNDCAIEHLCSLNSKVVGLSIRTVRLFPPK